MFNYSHYVPILRWKSAEEMALGKLSARDRMWLTPLVEIVPKNVVEDRDGWPIVSRSKLVKVADDIMISWGYQAIFVDMALLKAVAATHDDGYPLDVFAAASRPLGLHSIPVTGLDRSSAYQRAVASMMQQDARGVCVRLRSQDLQQKDFPMLLYDLLSLLQVDARSVDLLVDLGVTSGESPAFARHCHQVPELNRWRTFTVSGGSFPKDLGGLPIGQHILPRHEWRLWRDEVRAGACSTRLPAFGDYTIQHPIFREPPKFPNVSASIRYTIEEDWVVMRGEGLNNDGGPGYDQYPANAELLCRHREFCGSDFSYGDCYICERSQLRAQPGNPMTWLRAGVNHHLTFVVRQIANLAETVPDVAYGVVEERALAGHRRN